MSSPKALAPSEGKQNPDHCGDRFLIDDDATPSGNAQGHPALFLLQSEALAEQVEINPEAGLVVGVAHLVAEGGTPARDRAVFTRGPTPSDRKSEPLQRP